MEDDGNAETSDGDTRRGRRKMILSVSSDLIEIISRSLLLCFFFVISHRLFRRS